MSVKNIKLTDAEVSAIMAQREAIIAPYRKLAQGIATAVAAGKALNEKAQEGKRTLWDSFKAAMKIAVESHHTAEALRDGLSLACAEAEIPTGSFRSYVATTADLFALVKAEKLDLSKATGLKIKEARELVMPADKKQLAELKARFAELTAEYTAEQWVDLITLIAPAAADTGDSEGEAEEGERKAA